MNKGLEVDGRMSFGVVKCMKVVESGSQILLTAMEGNGIGRTREGFRKRRRKGRRRYTKWERTAVEEGGGGTSERGKLEKGILSALGSRMQKLPGYGNQISLRPQHDCLVLISTSDDFLTDTSTECLTSTITMSWRMGPRGAVSLHKLWAKSGISFRLPGQRLQMHPV